MFNKYIQPGHTEILQPLPIPPMCIPPILLPICIPDMLAAALGVGIGAPLDMDCMSILILDWQSSQQKAMFEHQVVRKIMEESSEMYQLYDAILYIIFIYWIKRYDWR